MTFDIKVDTIRFNRSVERQKLIDCFVQHPCGVVFISRRNTYANNVLVNKNDRTLSCENSYVNWNSIILLTEFGEPLKIEPLRGHDFDPVQPVQK